MHTLTREPPQGDWDSVAATREWMRRDPIGYAAKTAVVAASVESPERANAAFVERMQGRGDGPAQRQYARWWTRAERRVRRLFASVPVWRHPQARPQPRSRSRRGTRRARAPGRRNADDPDHVARSDRRAA